jgi:hypothetical protein
VKVNLFLRGAGTVPPRLQAMEAINSPKIAENLETEKSVVDTYRGPEGQVLMILVGLIGSGKVNNQFNISLYI